MVGGILGGAFYVSSRSAVHIASADTWAWDGPDRIRVPGEALGAPRIAPRALA